MGVGVSKLCSVLDVVRGAFLLTYALPADLRTYWDPGYCFVTFAEPQHAEAAVSALDGAPGCVPGCNMFVDFAEVKDTARYTFPTEPAAESASEQEPPKAR